MSLTSQASDLIYKHSAVWEKVWQECDGLENELLSKQPAENTWSILEIIEHCILAGESSTEYLLKSQQNPESPGKLSGLKPIFIKLLMKLPIKVKVPMDSLKPKGKETLSSLKSRETAFMAEWNRLIDSLDEKSAAALSVKHPIFGNLNLLGIVSFLDDHLQRHLRQLIEVKKKLSSKNNPAQKSTYQAANL